MTRRQLLTSAASLAASRAFGQTAYPGVAYRDYSRCLPDYLRDVAAAAYRLRTDALARLSTPVAIRDRQKWVRDTFWKLIGGMPERTPLNARVTGTFQRDGYRVEKLVYESRPRFFVPANLYIPANARPPFPGVLFQMGHSLNGKAAAAYQRCCQGLVKLGYLVLAFDPMGQGERVYYPDSTGRRTRLRSADDEHTVPGKQMLLTGDSAVRMQVWDAVRSLDYLAAHPMVDAKRLASTGQSGGGTVTMLLMAADDRLAAAAVMSGNTENVACAAFNPPGSTDDAEQDFVGSGPVGFDRCDLLWPFAPKPLLISVSDKDFFGTYSPSYISDGWEEFNRLKKAYQTLGAVDKIAWGGTPLPHSLAYDSRLLVYNWFDRWLKNGPGKITKEPPTNPEPDETLWISDSGSMVRSFHSETPYSLNRARTARRSAAPLAELIRMDKPATSALTVLRRVSGPECFLEAAEIASAAKVWLPAWVITPVREDSSKPAIIVLEPAGRNVLWQEGALGQLLAAQGFLVVAPDLRGIGDLSPEYGRGSPRYTGSHQSEENYAWASLILGRPLIGQRTADLLAVINAVSQRRKPVAIAARGKMCVPALFAAHIAGGISSVYLASGLESFRSIVDSENYNEPLANFVPGILNHTDLPEIAKTVKLARGTEWTAEAISRACTGRSAAVA